MDNDELWSKIMLELTALNEMVKPYSYISKSGTQRQRRKSFFLNPAPR